MVKGVYEMRFKTVMTSQFQLNTKFIQTPLLEKNIFTTPKTNSFVLKSKVVIFYPLHSFYDV